MVGYGNRHRSHQDAINFIIFNVYSETNPVAQSTVSKLVKNFKETELVKEMPRTRNRLQMKIHYNNATFFRQYQSIVGCSHINQTLQSTSSP